ncbi:tRNA lysidine(34) synthetase TilS [Aliifodinibius sp. S!AR15-10]|uniref:tRNA lysidine(34) synthetase TilS n=1 Tax=Aliifodinibius sp. S!AR15-10 TaxID=2950437 RepID=UPI0028597541|nr:tRNA lysidine(34) synthetase TilS [Aliifodinibius sp. S!AR15-10]MDR8394057.1 tRNA lysidine(34) synthetase TilS [Aliifodinibius sp. S!AR15-10]
MSKSDLSSIENRVAQHLATYFAGESPSFVAGVSGGPDSMALLYILKRLEVEVVVVHVNYQKRGEASEKDQELVEQMSDRWGFDCHTVRLDPAEAEGQNFQQWARKRRYQVFRELQNEYGSDGIAIAHHQDDQVETVLQKLFRGAGLASWSAMSVWEPPLFRPLLDTTQKQVMDYIEERAIPYRTDRSNLENDFARNLLRNEWLDKMGDFFPGWRKNVLRLPQQAELFTEALTCLEEQVTDNRDRINLTALGELSIGLQKALILHMLKGFDPDIEVTTGALDQLEDLASLQTGKSIQLTEHYSLLNDRNWLKFVYEQPDSLTLIKIREEDLKKKPFSFDGLRFSVQEFVDPDYENTLYLDLEKITWPLSLRRWKAGDAFQPFGMVGHQNVSDHLTNRKISAAEKRKALVLESFEETIAAVIFPPIEKITPPGTISEFVKCDQETSECLVISWSNS